MIGVVIEQAFKSRCEAWRPAPVRLRRFCTLTCNRIPGVSAMHVDVQPAAHAVGDLHVDVQSLFLLSQEIWPGDFGLTKDILHVNVQPPRHYRRQRALHVNVHPVAAPAVDGLHVDVQNPFLLLWEDRPDSYGATEMGLHVNVQRLRWKRQRWSGTLSPHSKQKASRQLRPGQNLGLSHFGARK